jgi:hypothetical protein
MQLTTIEFKKDNLSVEVEVNKDSSYSISIRQTPEEVGEYNKSFIDFRTDEVSIDSLIEALEFIKNYNFEQ